MASVLHVVPYYPPDRIGGVGEVVATLHRGLLATGHRSHVVTTGHGRDDPHVTRVARGPAGFALGSLRALGLAEAADVIHVHHGEAIGLLLALRLASRRPPILLTQHVDVRLMARSLAPYTVDGHRLGRSSWSEAASRRLTLPLRVAMDRVALAVASDVSFIARSVARETLGHAAAAARVIYNAVPQAPAATIAPPVELLYVGADSPRKRVELLPLVLHAVRRRVPQARLRIVGLAADANPALHALAAALGVADAIEFTGPLRSEAIAPHYAAARVLLVPSAYEGLPMVILEAFAQGLPCVATQVSGHPEVVTPGENGYLVDLDAPEAMAQRAVELLEDAPRRAQFSAAARQTVAERFGVERQVAAYLAWYGEHIRTRSAA